MTLYFRNLNHEPGCFRFRAVNPVTVCSPDRCNSPGNPGTAAAARPLPNEEHQYRVGPVIDTAVLIEDIYIKDRLCVIHWQCDDPLFPAQTGYHG